MSGSDTKSNDKQLQLLVESIANKINNSPALNGGFDRMMVIVEHIQEKQSETSDKLDKIHDGLYDPDEGLYARVKMIETTTQQFSEKHSAHIDNDDKNMSQINISLKKLTDSDSDLVRKAETTQKLKKIAGDDLERLAKTLDDRGKWSRLWNKAFWIVAGGALAGVGKALYELLAHK